MPSHHSYEKSRFSDRLKELGILGAFIAGAALCSVLLMDLIVYPTGLFAVKNKALFTIIVKYLSLLLLLLGMSSVIAGRFLRLKRDGFGFREIAYRIGRRSLQMLTWFLLSLGFAGALITVIYFLLGYNYYLLYKLTQI